VRERERESMRVREKENGYNHVCAGIAKQQTIIGKQLISLQIMLFLSDIIYSLSTEVFLLVYKISRCPFPFSYLSLSLVPLIAKVFQKWG
jgi:hypothetical protein